MTPGWAHMAPPQTFSFDAGVVWLALCSPIHSTFTGGEDAAASLLGSTGQQRLIHRRSNFQHRGRKGYVNSGTIGVSINRSSCGDLAMCSTWPVTGDEDTPSSPAFFSPFTSIQSTSPRPTIPKKCLFWNNKAVRVSDHKTHALLYVRVALRFGGA